jgi:hypothetical protein
MKMQIRKVALASAVTLAVLLPSVAMALDYFGTIEKNRLILKLEAAAEEKSAVPSGEFPCYLVLTNGYPVLSKEASVEAGNKARVGKLDIVHLVELPDKKDRKPDETAQAFLERVKSKVKHTEYLLFEFSQGGWSADKYVTLIRIPYSVDEKDEKQMLKIAGEGTMEVQWRDPKSKAVTVVSYWSGMSPPFPIKVTVVESTLGFQNKLGSE